MRLVLAAAVALTTLGSSMAFAYTEMECADMFRKADANNDGVVAEAEATRYLAAMRVYPAPTPADDKLDDAEFVMRCRNVVSGPGRVSVAPPPLRGAAG